MSGSVYRIYRELSTRSKYAVAVTGRPVDLDTAKYRSVLRINIWTVGSGNRATV